MYNDIVENGLATRTECFRLVFRESITTRNQLFNERHFFGRTSLTTRGKIKFVNKVFIFYHHAFFRAFHAALVLRFLVG